MMFQITGKSGRTPGQGITNMQVLLKRSDSRQDIQCNICGQGFHLYWEPRSTVERVTMRSIIIGELRDHHSREYGDDQTSSAHPAESFSLPNWLNPTHFSSAALFSRPLNHALS